MTNTGDSGLDALADAIAERVLDRIRADQQPTYIDAKEVARRLGRSVRSVYHIQDRSNSLRLAGQSPDVPMGSSAAPN